MKTVFIVSAGILMAVVCVVAIVSMLVPMLSAVPQIAGHVAAEIHNAYVESAK